MAQNGKGPFDTIRLSARIFGTDTLPSMYLDPVFVYAARPAWAILANKRKKEYNRDYEILKYNVRKVYPYAVKAAWVYHDVDSVLAGLYSKDAKKKYKELREEQLNKEFKDELTNLTINQGQILVKLIARQTGKSVYEILKTLKGGFKATIWQGVALFWSNNLKNNYDPNGADVDIESIVKEIEAQQYK
jgi:hypothetical protein